MRHSPLLDVAQAPEGPAAPAPAPGPAADDFAALYREHFRDVYGYCWNRLRQQQAAEDAAAQVFVRALHAMPTYRERGRLRAWLLTIARNVIVSQARREHPSEPLDLAGDLPAGAPPPDEQAIAALDVEALERAIDALPEPLRAAIELRRFGLTGEEVARELGISHEAAKKRLSRAMALLRERLGGSDADDGGRHAS
jgi:RNA polymerase sigma-70 factor (ECF subfamily)